MELPLVKIKVNHDNFASLFWQDIFVIPTEDARTKANKLPLGEFLNANIKEVPEHLRRSNEQLNLYWASCQCIAENSEDRNWSTKDLVDEQTKITLRHIDSYFYYMNQKTGEQTLQLRTKSISFKELEHLEACAYFDRAFELHAERMGKTVDEWIEIVKSKMLGAA